MSLWLYQNSRREVKCMEWWCIYTSTIKGANYSARVYSELKAKDTEWGGRGGEADSRVKVSGIRRRWCEEEFEREEWARIYVVPRIKGVRMWVYAVNTRGYRASKASASPSITHAGPQHTHRHNRAWGAGSLTRNERTSHKQARAVYCGPNSSSRRCQADRARAMAEKREGPYSARVIYFLLLLAVLCTRLVWVLLLTCVRARDVAGVSILHTLYTYMYNNNI